MHVRASWWQLTPDCRDLPGNADKRLRQVLDDAKRPADNVSRPLTGKSFTMLSRASGQVATASDQADAGAFQATLMIKWTVPGLFIKVAESVFDLGRSRIVSKAEEGSNRFLDSLNQVASREVAAVQQCKSARHWQPRWMI